MPHDGVARVESISWTKGSGLVTLHLRDNLHGFALHCDAGPFFRAVRDLPLGTKLEGKVISYTATDYGTLASFSIEEE